RTARQALDGAGDAPPEVIAGLLQNLGAAHRARCTVTTDLGDLDHAMDALREAAKLVPANTSGGATILDGLANASADPHTRRHEASDRDEAIALYEQVLERSSLGPRETATVRANLGLALSERYRASSQPQDLDTAIELTRQALDELQGDAAARPGALHNLG